MLLVLGLAFGFGLGKLDSSAAPAMAVTKGLIAFCAGWFLLACAKVSFVARCLQFCAGWGIGAIVAVAFF